MTSDQRIALVVFLVVLVGGGGIFLIVSVAGGDEEAVGLAEMRACVERLDPYSVVDDPEEWIPLSEHAGDGFGVNFYPTADESDDLDKDGTPDDYSHYGWSVSVAVMESEQAATSLFGQIQDFYEGGISEDYAYNVDNVFFAWQGDSSTEHPDTARSLEACVTS
jgi:hypothetical protein